MSDQQPKPINAWPLIALLVVIVFLVLFLNGWI